MEFPGGFVAPANIHDDIPGSDVDILNIVADISSGHEATGESFVTFPGGVNAGENICVANAGGG